MGRGGEKRQRTSLQYSPHALQLSSSLRPRRHSGVWVAPQLEHSALTPPGAELTVLFCCEEFTGVAPGPVERVLTDCVRTLRDGRLPVLAVVAWLAPGPEFGPMREGVIVRGTTSSIRFNEGRSPADLRRRLSSSPAPDGRWACCAKEVSFVATFISTSS